jgi:hypothetical protein
LAPLSIGVILCSVIYSGGTYNIFCLFLICNKDRTNLISPLFIMDCKSLFIKISH